MSSISTKPEAGSVQSHTEKVLSVTKTGFSNGKSAGAALAQPSLVGKYNVRLPSDEFHPCIYGAVVLTDGNVVMSDSNNDTLKVLDGSRYDVIQHMDLPGEPYDVCVTGPDEVCVAMLEGKCVQFVKVGQAMEKKGSIQVGEKCQGVGYSNGAIYVTCGGDCREGPGQLRVYSRAGELLDTWGLDSQNQSVFSIPFGVAVSGDGAKIHVADVTHGVITFDRDGNILWRSQEPDLECGRGICVDGVDHVYACGYASDNVIQLDANGRKVRNLLTDADGIVAPRSVCYDPARRRFIVKMSHNNYINVFNM